jgi:hypothetical protein
MKVGLCVFDLVKARCFVEGTAAVHRVPQAIPVMSFLAGVSSNALQPTVTFAPSVRLHVVRSVRVWSVDRTDAVVPVRPAVVHGKSARSAPACPVGVMARHAAPVTYVKVGTTDLSEIHFHRLSDPPDRYQLHSITQ